MDEESGFLLYIKSIFRKWIGFQAAIDEGMGGLYAREKEVWLAVEVENYFKKYDDVRSEDMAEYLGTMIENEFETYFEDGSLAEVSQNFCNAYKLFVMDPNAQMFQLRPGKVEGKSPIQEKIEVKTDEKTEMETSVVTEMRQLTVCCPEDEGWTTVTRGNRRSK